MKRAAALLLAGLMTLAVPAGAETYRLSTGGPPNHPWGYGARVWADRVAERTGGRIVFDVVPGLGQAGVDGMDAFAALSGGSIDAAVGSSLAWSGQVPSLALFALPCLIDGPDDLDPVLNISYR